MTFHSAINERNAIMSRKFSPIRSIHSMVINYAKELAFPSTCAMCDQRGTWLCADCSPNWVPLLPSLACDRCGHPLSSRGCFVCRSMHPAIVYARAVAAYDGWPETSLKRLKYDRERDRSVFIANQMLVPLDALGLTDVLIPVPLHEAKQQDRGFNQSEVIAKHLRDARDIPVENALIRVRATASQTKLNREQREANMTGAIELAPGWVPDRSKRYVLVDDVYTTGSTAGACVEQLSLAGIDKISVLTFVFDLSERDLERYRRLVTAAVG